MEDINIETIKWSAYEYDHKEHSVDWYWTIGLATLVVAGVMIWIKSYIFAVFIIISGASLTLFSIRHPETVTYVIENEGLIMGKDKYSWDKIKGFDIIKRNGQNKLLIELDKYFLPVYTIPLYDENLEEIKDSLLKVIPLIELKESQSMIFIEKLGL